MNAKFPHTITLQMQHLEYIMPAKERSIPFSKDICHVAVSW